MLARYGEGATLIRKPWKPRPESTGSTKDDDEDSDSNVDALSDPKADPGPSTSVVDEKLQVLQGEKAASKSSRSTTPQAPQASDDLDDLASSMKSLNLVPTSIRFGRGARRAGFVRRGAARGGISNVTPDTTSLRKRDE